MDTMISKTSRFISASSKIALVLAQAAFTLRSQECDITPMINGIQNFCMVVETLSKDLDSLQGQESYQLSEHCVSDVQNTSLIMLYEVLSALENIKEGDTGESDNSDNVEQQPPPTEDINDLQQAFASFKCSLSSIMVDVIGARR